MDLPILRAVLVCCDGRVGSFLFFLVMFRPAPLRPETPRPSDVIGSPRLGVMGTAQGPCQIHTDTPPLKICHVTYRGGSWSTEIQLMKPGHTGVEPIGGKGETQSPDPGLETVEQGIETGAFGNGTYVKSERSCNTRRHLRLPMWVRVPWMEGTEG